ncbi:MAG: LysM peptidoglycan-binding domain-containing protein [Chloroflexi bacterium]|nr:MAG: LysM peptidoglycan-binding domain-containing protein [Chloroflexota bacterium]
MLAHMFAKRKRLFGIELDTNGCSCYRVGERMFVKDGASKDYLRLPARRRGWGRILGLAALLMLVSARLAYGSEPAPTRSVVVVPGDTLWSIAQTHYAGDPRPRVEQILLLNHLASPQLLPGQSLQIPRA